jgi:hypothetical protein
MVVLDGCYFIRLVGFWLGYARVSIGKYQTSMPKLTQWAEGNIPEGLSVFGLGLCEFNRKRLRISNMINRLNQSVK